MRLCIFLMVLLLGTVKCKLTSSKQVYTIGGWNERGGSEKFMREWKPLLADYLTATVGPHYDPPISFQLIPIDWTNETTAEKLIEEGRLDFIYSERGRLCCHEGDYDFSPLAMQISRAAGKDYLAAGATFYSLQSNTEVRNISDFRGKRLGVGHHLLPSSYQLGFEMLTEHGMNMWVDPSQVIFYGTDYSRQFNDVLSGAVDVGIVTSGWLEDNHPDKMDLLHFHYSNLSINLYVSMGIPTLFQAQSIPFITSTDLVPLNGVAAAPSIQSHLRESVLQALVQLDPAKVPAMHAAGLSKFTIPSSYVYPRTLAEEAGIMKATDTRTQCVGPYPHVHDIVHCPDLYDRLSDADVDAACSKAGLACPQGLLCLCRPCATLVPANFYPWPVVLGLCCALFFVGIWFALCWRIPLESVSLVVPKYDILASATGAGRGGGKSMA